MRKIVLNIRRNKENTSKKMAMKNNTMKKCNYYFDE